VSARQINTLIFSIIRNELVARVKFTSALKRFFPALTEGYVHGTTVRETLLNIEKTYPGILGYLIEDNGELRRHVNIFVKGELIRDRATLNDQVGAQDELIIFQALSGG
jgi:molybdopterin synthase sulfur carrier subunit